MHTPSHFGKTFFWVVFSLIIVLYALKIANANLLAVAGSDFLNTYVGAVLIRNGKGTLLYSQEDNYAVQKQVLGEPDWKNINVFRLLPFTAVLLSPLTAFPVIEAFKIFSFANLLLVLIFTIMAKSRFKNINRHCRFLFLTPLLFVPFIENLKMGQTSFLLAFLLFIVFILLKSEKSFLPGVLSAFFLIKTQHVIITPFIFLLSEKKLKFLSGFLSGLVFILIISIQATSLNQLLYYPKYLNLTENPDFGSRVGNFFSFYSLLANLNIVSIGKNAALFVNTLFYFAVLLLFRAKIKKMDFETSFALTALFSLAFSVHTLSFDLCMLIVPLLIFLNKAVKNKKLNIQSESLVAGLLFLVPLLLPLKIPYLASVLFLLAGIFFLKANGKFQKQGREV